MHTYDDTETHASLVRTFPDLTGWSLTRLLDEYADLAYDYIELSASGDAEIIETAQDMARIVNEIERRTLDRHTHDVAGAEVEQ